MRTILGGIATLLLYSAVLVGTVHAQTEWYTYRYDKSRTGSQPTVSDLSYPDKVADPHLAVQWSFPPDGEPPAGAFKASPIVVNDTVFIGSLDGYFYAVDAATGGRKWQFPQPPDPPLLGSCSRYGQY